jgi:hypothetical protein
LIIRAGRFTRLAMREAGEINNHDTTLRGVHYVTAILEQPAIKLSYYVIHLIAESCSNSLKSRAIFFIWFEPYGSNQMQIALGSVGV